MWQSLEADHPDDWFVLLNDGPSALDWRLRAIDTATESLDLQTFLWSLDTAGSMVLDHIVAAADRGVEVKLLIDDTFLLGEDEMLLELHHHPNIDYRVFNPYKRRANGFATRMALNLGEFHRLDHRMHNKSMIVDNRIAIVGGRNIADEYFGLHSEANFRDAELVVGGPIVQAITDSFDDYWNDRWSLPIDQLSHVKPSPADLDAARHVRDQNVHVHDEETAAERFERWRALVDSSVSGRATLFVDEPPQGNLAEIDEAPIQIANLLQEVVEGARSEIIIISAYLIPTDRVEALFEDVIGRGVRVRILTNSIGSNNHLTAHSAYRNHVNEMLEDGVELHEMRTDAANREVYMLTPVATKKLGLHTKALVIDDDIVFIGSPNLDPRSMRLNTEMGLLIESEALNSMVREAMLPDFSTSNAWHLQIDADGNVLWVSDDETLTAQPATSTWQRIEDWFFRHMPIEGEL